MPQKKIKKTIGLRLNIRWRKGNRLLGFRCGTNKRRRKNEIIFYDWWGVGCSVDGRLVSFWTSPNPATPSPRLRRTTLTRFKHHTNSTQTSITSHNTVLTATLTLDLALHDDVTIKKLQLPRHIKTESIFPSHPVLRHFVKNYKQ